MFTKNCWYFVKAPYRGGNGMKGLRIKEPVFQVVEVNLFGSAKKVRYVSGETQSGNSNNGGIILTAGDWGSMESFIPSGNTKFQPGGRYRAVHNGIIDCLKIRGASGKFKQYTALCNVIRGNGYSENAAVFSIRRAFHEIAPKISAWLPSTGCFWNFENKPVNLPDYMAAFFDLVQPETKSNDADTMLDNVIDIALTNPSASQKEIVKEAENRLNKPAGVLVSEEDAKLIESIKFLLKAREHYTGNRIRLSFMEETYSRDTIKTEADIIELAKRRQEEIKAYIENKQSEISRTQELLSVLENL